MSARIGASVAFFSGFVALGYEILWARRLSDIIGATSFASSLVVGTFFLALAAGAARFGPVATRHPAPWKLYALLEAGILVAVLPSFAAEALSGAVFAAFGPALLQPFAGLLLKTALALVFVAPASFLMGGTLPALGQAVVHGDRLGREGNAIYGLNTMGGALGIVVTTFALIPELGLRLSFGVLMVGSLLLALFAWSQAKGSAQQTRAVRAAPAAKRARSKPATQAEGGTSQHAWLWLAAVSGFAVLGLEILALHMFSQVLHNSGYTFATVLVLVIAALTVGPLVTQWWKLDAQAAWQRAGLAILASACVAAALPRLFFEATGGLVPFGSGSVGLHTYILRIIGVGAAVLGPLFVLSGWVFPLVLSGVGTLPGGVGERWGKLLGFNALGALLGLLLANHVAMPRLGVWWSFVAWSAVLVVAGTLAAFRMTRPARLRVLTLAVAWIVVVVASTPGSLPVVHLSASETVLASSAGPDGVAAVIDLDVPGGDKRIKWNNTYSLGGTANRAQQARLGYLPLLLHPQPRTAAFIGLATGITASSALRDASIQRLTAVELSAQITRLACEHYADTNANVCDAARSHVVVEDGRMFFRATRERFDVVVGDLFVPWRSGVATLFTREHFESVHERLQPGGLFAQWLPLFQLDERGFWGIATTFASVFPNAWLALADFQPYGAAVALIGWRDAAGGPRWDVLTQRCSELGAQSALREPLLSVPEAAGLFLVGPVRPALPVNLPVMTLDRPWLADHAPRVQRGEAGPFFLGQPLVRTFDAIARHVPEGPLQVHTRLGVQLFEFCERYERTGAAAAGSWYESNVATPLPSVFVVRRPERLNWPFTEQTGMYLVRAARQQARSRAPGR